MNRLAGIIFKKNENGESIGYMRNAIDKEMGYEYPIKRYEDKPLKTRYYIDSDTLKICLGDYLSDRTLRRIEKYYQNHRADKIKEDRLYQMVVRLLDFEAVDNQIKV